MHHETATPVQKRILVACQTCPEAGGEKAEVLAVLKDVEFLGSVITMVDLHTSRSSAMRSCGPTASKTCLP